MTQLIRAAEAPKPTQISDEVIANIINIINSGQGKQGKILFSIKDACQMLSLSRATISGAIQKGKLKYYKFGTRKLFSVQHLLDYKELIARGEAR